MTTARWLASDGPVFRTIEKALLGVCLALFCYAFADWRGWLGFERGYQPLNMVVLSGAMVVQQVAAVVQFRSRLLCVLLMGVAAESAVYVLGTKGYVKIRETRNGFTCLVSRQRPDTLEPECFDAVGTLTVVPVRIFVEAQRAAGTAEAEIERLVDEGYRKGIFKAPARPGLVYMLSDHNYVFDPERQQIIHFPGHLMFYAPFATQKDVGRGPGAPYIVAPGTPHALMIVVPAGNAHGSNPH